MLVSALGFSGFGNIRYPRLGGSAGAGMVFTESLVQISAPIAGTIGAISIFISVNTMNSFTNVNIKVNGIIAYTTALPAGFVGQPALAIPIVPIAVGDLIAIEVETTPSSAGSINLAITYELM